MSAVEDVLFNDNSFYNDLEQLRLDIDAYVDVTSKRISSKRFEKKAFLKKKKKFVQIMLSEVPLHSDNRHNVRFTTNQGDDAPAVSNQHSCGKQTRRFHTSCHGQNSRYGTNRARWQPRNRRLRARHKTKPVFEGSKYKNHVLQTPFRD